MAQEGLGNLDEKEDEGRRLDEENEREIRLAEIAKLISPFYKLDRPMHTPVDKVAKKYGETNMKKVSLKELDEIIASLKKKR